MVSDYWQLGVTPRGWQINALELWKEKSQGIVSVVTGGGKTIFAEMCMIDFKNRYPSAQFIIITPTISLLDQWYVSLREDLSVPKGEISCFSSQEKHSVINTVNLIVINSARELSPMISNASETMLIVDECHRAGSKENAKSLQGSHKGVLGLSATPEREYDDGFREFLQPTLGNIIYSYGYNQALEDGVISAFEMINVRVDLLSHEKVKYDRLSKSIAVEIQRLKRSGGADDRLKILLQRRSAVGSTAAMRIPVAAKIADSHRGERTLIFHERVSAADKLLSILEKRLHSVTAYHSSIGPILRRDNLRLYRRGVYNILITCRALDEGLNVPETTVAIVASSTASIRQRIQRLGRVLRPSPKKKTALVYTIYATDQEEARLVVEAKRYQDISSITWYKGYKNKNG